jgi:hypothetical protein
MSASGTGHSNAASERNGLVAPNSSDCQSFAKGQRMRRFDLPTEQDLDQGQQTVFFHIANGNLRQACSVKTKFPTKEKATKYVRQNWTKIEQMARDRLASGSLEDGQIKLVML